jgi:geranylgeranylglycerol-phosphate geranylgeranyltransferase
MNKFVAILRLTRIEHSAMLVVAVVAAELIASSGLPSANLLILSMITPIFVSMGAFAINDYFDVKVDRINKKNRPLVTGDLTKSDALWVTAFSFIIGVGASYFINIYCFTMALVFAILSLLYSYRLKELFFWGNLSVALTGGAIPFIFGSYVVSSSIGAGIALVAIGALCGNLAREIHGTIRDYKGDLRVRRTNTLPKALGVKNSAIIALIFYMITIVLTFYLLLYVRPFRSNLVFGSLMLIADVMFLYVGFGCIKYSSSRRFYDRARNVSLIAMGVSIVSFLLAPLFAA